MTDSTELLKSYLPNYAESQLEKSKSKNMYVCPFCGSGTGKNHTGALSIKENYYKCFACNATGDIFTLFAKLNSLDNERDFREIKESLSQMYNISTDTMRESPAKPKTETPKKADFSDYVEKCKNAIAGALPYLHSRGFTDETIKKFRLGYDLERKALVIPYNSSNSYYITRSIESKRFYKPKSEDAGAEPIYNIHSLYTESPCFICESQLDAISIEQVGGKAIAIGGAGYNKLIEQVKSKRPTQALILCLDNDAGGNTTRDNIAKSLQDLNISFIIATFTLEQYPEALRKDANELLQGNSNQLAIDVSRIIKEAQNGKKQLTEAEEHLESSRVKNYLEKAFYEDLVAFSKHNKRSTGFTTLDSVSGGLYNGFYVIGAISSLGKTTFVHQIADQLAQAGEHILYFSLEQSRLELVTKSISRLIAKRYGATDYVSSIAIRSGELTNEQKAKVREALTQYETIADKITIVQSDFDADVKKITEVTEAYIKANGVTPVVIVDYLQIINVEGNQSDKQKIDTVVRGLKQLQSKHNLALIAISSVNRGNYLNPIDFESFKESGIIEYSADVVYGLQLKVLTEESYKNCKSIVDQREKVKEAKSSTPRLIELVCLKNRYGISSYSDYFEYYPTCDYFKEVPEPTTYKRY